LRGAPYRKPDRIGSYSYSRYEGKEGIRGEEDGKNGKRILKTFSGGYPTDHFLEKAGVRAVRTQY